MKEKKIPTLKELLTGALSLEFGKSAEQWESHLVDGFNAVLGGEDVFNSDIRRYTGGYILVTLADRNEVSFDMYECGSVALNGIDRMTRQYSIKGTGFFTKCSFGDCFLVRQEIERTYRRADEMIGYTDFQKIYGKQSPYSAEADPWLIDTSNGVIDCIESHRATRESSIILSAAISSRFYAKQYQDIRRFIDFDGLVEGLYNVWRALISLDKQDWKLFSTLVRKAFNQPS
jgi:hypothetical protein